MTLMNRFDLEATFFGVVRVRRVTPLRAMTNSNFTLIWKIEIPYQKDFGWLVGALKTRFNTLSLYKLVSNQSYKWNSIYLQKRDKARENCRKFKFLIQRTFFDLWVL